MALILILDDRATNRNIYARLAAAIEPGIVTEVFADPLDALEWLQANRVDLVITDYRMPGMDGAEFTSRFRAMPNGALVPVMVVTAYDDRSFRLRALDAGATDFLQTPIDHFELVTRARNLLALGRQAASPAGPAHQPRPASLHSSQPAASDAPRDAPGDAPRDVPGDARPRGVIAGVPGHLVGPPLARPMAALPEGLSAAELASILDSLPALVSVVDRAGLCRYVNATQAAWIGRPVAELAGRPAALLVAPDRAARSRQEDLTVFETGAALPARREEAIGPDGTWSNLLTIKTPLRDAAGGTAAVLTVAFELPGVPGPAAAKRTLGSAHLPGPPDPPAGVADG